MTCLEKHIVKPQRIFKPPCCTKAGCPRPDDLCFSGLCRKSTAYLLYMAMQKVFIEKMLYVSMLNTPTDGWTTEQVEKERERLTVDWIENHGLKFRIKYHLSEGTLVQVNLHSFFPDLWSCSLTPSSNVDVPWGESTLYYHELEGC